MRHGLRSCRVARTEVLQEELSAAQRDRSAAAVPPGQMSSSSESAQESADEHEWRDQISELANAVTNFLEEAEKDIAAHPAQSNLHQAIRDTVRVHSRLFLAQGVITTLLGVAVLI